MWYFLYRLSIHYPDSLGVLNVLQYIRSAAMAAVTPGDWCPDWTLFYYWLRQMKLGRRSVVKGPGPVWCIRKSGHPTMGGTLIGGSDHFNTAVKSDQSAGAGISGDHAGAGNAGISDDCQIKKSARVQQKLCRCLSGWHWEHVCIFLSPVIASLLVTDAFKNVLFHWGYSIFLSWLLC